jgi:uncharacterized membrane protein/predicted DsbA family dithiol-disulfide isomerase
MQIATRLHLTRLLALIALSASVALLAHYIEPNPHFCGFHSHCDDVLNSTFGNPLGIPLPVLGIVSFGGIFTASLIPSQLSVWFVRLAAVAVGASGCALLCLQAFAIGQWCPYCVVVDVSAMLLALVAGLNAQASWPPTKMGVRGIWAALAMVALGSGVGLGFAGAENAGAETLPAPPQIKSLWVSGKVNVVEIADFKCPHCRKMHFVLTRLLEEEGERVHFVRLTAPMPSHPQSRHASRAFLCAQAQGRENDMAESLFRADDLSPGACEQLADSIGLSLVEYRACVRFPEVDQRLDADMEWVKAASPHGLPAIWIQDRMIFGVQSLDVLRSAVRAEREPPE